MPTNTQTITGIRVEHHAADALGIGTGCPRISWTYDPQADPVPLENAMVRIRARRSLKSGPVREEMVLVPASSHILLPWPFEPVASGEQVRLSACLAGDNGHDDRWCPQRVFEPGLLHLHEKRADMVGPAWFEPGTDRRHAPVIRSTADMQDEPVWARLYLSAYGLVDAEINGSRVGGDILTPGWTDYRHRLNYWTYDVAHLLGKGTNVLGFFLGDGWYRGRIGWDGGEADCYGDRLGVWAQLEVAFADGTTQTVASNSYDGQWLATKGPIVHSGLYEGECHDARLMAGNWADPDFIPGDQWQPVRELKLDPRLLCAPQADPVRRIGMHEPLSIMQTDDGGYILDFGQNCTQRLEIDIPACPSGHAISIRHAEALNLDGDLAIAPLRRASQCDTYISDGRKATWEPRFTIHGFRYARIDGWPQDADISSSVRSHVYGSVMRRSGWFSSSDSMVNHLYANIRWSMLSNFVSIPTDCPQRDERLGWTGDIAVFAPTASFIYDTSAFLASWLDDVAYDTYELGSVPGYVPFIPLVDWRGPNDLAIWGDSAVLVPWALYMENGDRAMLGTHYPLCRYWVERVATLLSDNGVWDRSADSYQGQLGDWLDPAAPSDNPTLAMTDKALVATAFFGHSVSLVSAMADALGNQDDRQRYERLAARIRRGFVDTFVREDGTMTSDTECAYALAIAFGLLDDDPIRKSKAGKRLAFLATQNGFTIATGFAGTPYVLPALSDTGHADEAYAMLMADEPPSWMYEVKMGATTTWERWDAILPDGSLNPGGMTSLNHYALGSVGDWIFSRIGGIKATEPGWSHFVIHPQPGGGVTSAHVRHATPHGMVDVAWELVDNNRMKVESVVPFGTTATLHIGTLHEELHAGKHLTICPIPAEGVS